MTPVQKASIEAQRADLAWTKQLFLAGFKSRWAEGSHGAPGTPLRAAYDAKLAADVRNHAAWEADRLAQSAQCRCTPHNECDYHANRLYGAEQA